MGKEAKRRMCVFVIWNAFQLTTKQKNKPISNLFIIILFLFYNGIQLQLQLQYQFSVVFSRCLFYIPFCFQRLQENENYSNNSINLPSYLSNKSVLYV